MAITKHSMSDTPEYWAWASARQRCENPKNRYYKNYGGRGIKFHEAWKDFATFIADVGPRPSALHSIDRWPNNDGDYEPGNVRWATQTQQLRNRRGRLSDVAVILIRGLKKRGALTRDLAHAFGVHEVTIRNAHRRKNVCLGFLSIGGMQ